MDDYEDLNSLDSAKTARLDRMWRLIAARQVSVKLLSDTRKVLNWEQVITLYRDERPIRMGDVIVCGICLDSITKNEVRLHPVSCIHSTKNAF